MPSGRIRRSEASALTRAPGDSQDSKRRPGRPSILGNRMRHEVYLDDQHRAMIATYQQQHGGSFSAALRAILDEYAKGKK